MNTEKQESFTSKAKREQKALIWFANSKKEDIEIFPSPTEYSSFDAWMNSGSTKFIVEAKVRTDYSASSIDRMGGAFFEFIKLSGIIQFKEKFGDCNQILYFNFFKDCLRVYKISSNPQDYVWEQKYLQKDDFDKTKIWKTVCKLSSQMLIETIYYK